MPKELLCVGPEALEWREYAEPALTAGQIRVRPRFAAAKHGTEMAFYKGYARPRGRFDSRYAVFMREPAGKANPFPVGNMVVGEVAEAAPDVTGLKVGDRVLAYGGFRTTHTLHADRCWKIPPDLSWKSAVCLDPADFALGAVRDGNVRVGDAAAVFGLGAIGLMGVQLLRAGGASPIIALDPVAERRRIAEQTGATLALDPAAGDAGLEIKQATGGRGADVVIEYSGARSALQHALRGVAYGGTVVAGAFPPPYDAGLDLGAEAHINIPNIVFSRSCSHPNRDHPRWDEKRIQQVCLAMLMDGRLTGDPIVTPVVRFDDLLTAYPRIAAGGECLKLGVEY